MSGRERGAGLQDSGVTVKRSGRRVWRRSCSQTEMSVGGPRGWEAVVLSEGAGDPSLCLLRTRQGLAQACLVQPRPLGPRGAGYQPSSSCAMES